ncbi:hypothetical protein [Cupriavidus sp. RAF12]|uniref:hypothetical protein n=1 Tax=Cupriavidus sp. RAF12 TaxID=3233050 RepID=UPI003F90B9F2
MNWTLEEMAAQAARTLHDGEFVDLGPGMPTTLVAHIPDDVELWVHLQEPRAGMTVYPTDDYMDAGFIAAGQEGVGHERQPTTYHSTASFAAMSSTHADVAVVEVTHAEALQDAVAGAVVSVGARRVLAMLASPQALDLLQGSGYSLPVRIVTPVAVADVTPQGLRILAAAESFASQRVQNGEDMLEGR